MTILGGAALLVLGVLPAAPPSEVRLLERPLELPGPPLALRAPADRPAAPDLSPVAARAWRIAASSEEPAKQGEPQGQGEGETKEQPGAKPPNEPGSLDFDLLGAPKEAKPVDEGALRLRRKLLTWHQGVGLGMFALQLATTAVGQLNYDDKFGGDNTGKYTQPHAILAYSTLAAFAAAGTLALLAPAPLRKDEGFDRVSLHKLAMLTATAGMVAQGVLGVWTQSREGYLNQQSLGTAHLVVGYVTLAAVATGVGALVF